MLIIMIPSSWTSVPCLYMALDPFEIFKLECVGSHSGYAQNCVLAPTLCMSQKVSKVVRDIRGLDVGKIWLGARIPRDMIVFRTLGILPNLISHHDDKFGSLYRVNLTCPRPRHSPLHLGSGHFPPGHSSLNRVRRSTSVPTGKPSTVRFQLCLIYPATSREVRTRQSAGDIPKLNTSSASQWTQKDLEL